MTEQLYRVRWQVEGTYDFYAEPGMTPLEAANAFDAAAGDLDVLGRGSVESSGVIEVDDQPVQ